MPATMPKVLLCDDEYGPRVSLEAMLDDEFECVEAETADAAITAVQSSQFDCAVIDWCLGRSWQIDSTEGARALTKILELDSTLGVVIWTAHAPHIRSEAMKLGALIVLGKPVTIEEAKAAVRHAIHVTRTRRLAKKTRSG
jgi:DNA-binding NtrC family response regulator